MVITDAVWEKRNLEIQSSTEIEVEEVDEDAETLEALKSQSADYVVAKLPVGRIGLLAGAEALGYHFVEAAITLLCKLPEMKIEGPAKRLEGQLTLKEMDQNDWGQLFREMKKGIFTTDRIYLDPLFKKENASQRYVNWTKDALADGAALYKCEIRSETAGFILMKGKQEEFSRPLLAGLYSNYKGTGLGCGLIAKLKDIAIREGTRGIMAGVSSNNAPILNIYISLGYKIKTIKYVLVKHNREG